MNNLKRLQQRANALEVFQQKIEQLTVPEPACCVEDRDEKYYREFEQIKEQFICDCLVVVGAQLEKDKGKLKAIEKLLEGE